MSPVCWDLARSSIRMTTMDHANMVNGIWPYLPAFRAVAETEHLPTAARQLHVVPSALSRSVRLLEEAVGAQLFARQGRRLVLNQRGRALLDALRQSVAGLERGLQPAGDEAFEGEFRVGTIGVVTNHVVLPVLLDLVVKRPKIVPTMRASGARESNHRLAIGALDLAFYYDATPMDGVWCERLGALGASVYCGRGHPLFGVRRVTQKALLEHPFSVPQIGDRNVPMDGWPVHIDRKVGLKIELLLTNLDVALSGRFVTVLPDVVARPHLEAKRLRRFNFDLVPPIEVFGACREGDQERALHRGVLDAVRAYMSEIGITE